MASLRTHTHELAFVIITAAIGLGVTGWLVMATVEKMNAGTAVHFNIAAIDRINVLKQAIANTLVATNSVVSLFLASEDVSQDEYRRFTSQTLKDSPYISALDWAPRKGSDDRGADRPATALDDLPIKDILPDGSLVPAKARGVYFPLYFVQSPEGPRDHLLGVDMMSDPMRRKAMEAAIAAKATVATPPLTLLTTKNTGMLLVAPIFRKETVDGFVLSVVPLAELIAEAIEPLSKEGVNIVAHDVSAGDEQALPVLVHASRLRPASRDEVMDTYRSSALRHEKTIEVAGRQWRITVVPSKGYFIQNKLSDVTGMAAAGAAFTLMLAYFMVSRIRENVRITSVVEQRTEELERLARYDALTGLANRRLFLELLQRAISRSRRANTKLAVVYIDLNDFKPVNDRLGHAAGDLLLKAFGDRIDPVLRDYDTMARLGGDEFAILVDNMKHMQDCDVLLERVLPLIKQPFKLGAGTVTIGASIGVAMYPDDADSLDSVLAAADTAMYRAKRDKSLPYVYSSKHASV